MQVSYQKSPYEEFFIMFVRLSVWGRRDLGK